MNPKSLLRSVLCILVAYMLIANATRVAASPDFVQHTGKVSILCPAAIAALSQVDIPSHRADYNLLSRAEQCSLASLNAHQVVLPITGAQENRFADFKDLQAELASGSEKYLSRITVTIPFAEFKEQQAEQRSQ